jgi:tRNA(His) guanylyltransferase
VLQRGSSWFQRRTQKMVSTIVSAFAAAFVAEWPRHFTDTALRLLPSFDGRAVCYPTEQALWDYLSWRQVDCYINSMYNACYWRLVQGSGDARSPAMSGAAANKLLGPTQSEHKHELLFSRFGVKFDKLPALERRGTLLIWSRDAKQKAENTILAPSTLFDFAAHAATTTTTTTTTTTKTSAQQETKESHQPKTNNKTLKSPSPSSSSVWSSSSSSSSEFVWPSMGVPSPRTAAAAASATAVKLSKKKAVSTLSLWSPQRNKRALVILHEDISANAEHFWTERFPSIIPFVSQTELTKRANKQKKLAYEAQQRAEEEQKQLLMFAAQ